MNLNRSVIYWKWEDTTLDSNLCYKIEDLCNRMDVDKVFIGLHWIKLPFSDRKLLDTLEFCTRELHKRGKKIIVEVCPRNEGAAFFQKYPEEVAFITTATEIPLDDQGRGEAIINTAGIPHYWRTIEHVRPSLLTAYTITLSGEHQFKYDSKRLIDNTAIVLTDSKDSTVVKVDAGADAAKKSAVVFIGIPQPIPDLASEHMIELYDSMLCNLEGINVDGAMSDEWGYDVIIGVNENFKDPNGKKKTEIYFEHVSYSKNFAKKYKELCGEELLESLLYFYYEEDGCSDKSIRKINAYHKTFRAIMRTNDEQMYSLCKDKLGKEAFYGVHPTWWGNDYLQNFEGFKNGLYWWEAKRDIAQTDEIVIMPIRTALAHKWGSDFWYNMWYSMGTRDIKTYYRHTWNNVRFGGRTHYLAYECPNEAVVLELKPQGLLESIEEMDSIIRTIDPYQKASPDCRVLILFGMENALNWFYNESAAPPWYPRHKILTPVLKCADSVFQKYLCDLVPTSEIENGSLTVSDGKAIYGTQQYDAVILLAPDSLGRACYSFISKIDASRLLVAGDAHEYDDGQPLSEQDMAILKQGKWLKEIYCPDEIITALSQWGIAENRFEKGCVLQDGSLIFTADGEYAVHNPLVINERYKDLVIQFEGEDMLYIHNDKGEYKPVYSKGTITWGDKTC